MLGRSRKKFGDREPKKRLEVGTEVWLQDKKPGGNNLWDRKSTIIEVRPSGSYKLRDEDGTEAIRNDKLVKPVFVKKPPAAKNKKTWADAVKNTNDKTVNNGEKAACEPCRKPADETNGPWMREDGVLVDISDKTLKWNNMVENAAKRIREEKKKKVNFAAGTKTTDGTGRC